MPSLIPGTPETKEAYRLSIIREDLSIKIPPKAFNRYELNVGDLVLLATTHRGEGGFAILNRDKPGNVWYTPLRVAHHSGLFLPLGDINFGKLPERFDPVSLIHR